MGEMFCNEEGKEKQLVERKTVWDDLLWILSLCTNWDEIRCLLTANHMTVMVFQGKGQGDWAGDGWIVLTLCILPGSVNNYSSVNQDGPI